MNLKEWLAAVPKEIVSDALWRMEVYRLALFACDLAWQDVDRLVRDKRTTGLPDQLYRAVGSIGANVAEGYSRRSGRDQARFYEYALGSAREARGWYYQSRHVLGEDIAQSRIDLMTQIIRLLLTIIPSERGSRIRKGKSIHSTTPDTLVDMP